MYRMSLVAFFCFLPQVAPLRAGPVQNISNSQVLSQFLAALSDGIAAGPDYHRFGYAEDFLWLPEAKALPHIVVAADIRAHVMSLYGMALSWADLDTLDTLVQTQELAMRDLMSILGDEPYLRYQMIPDDSDEYEVTTYYISSMYRLAIFESNAR